MALPICVNCESMKANEAIGYYLKHFRDAHELTLDAIADAANRYGAKWAASTVSDMEHGGRKVDALPNLLLLTAVLNDLLSVRGEAADISVSDLIGKSDVDITPSYSIPAEELADMIGTQPVRFPVDDGEEYADGISFATRPPITAAEKRASRKIGMEPEYFHGAFIDAFGKTLDEMVLEKAGRDASPQKRGSVTRQLISEMLAYLHYENTEA